MTAQDLSNACTLLRDTGAGASGWALEVPHGVAVQTVVGTPMHPAGQGPSDACPSHKPHPVIPRPDSAPIKGNGVSTGLPRKHEICPSRSMIDVTRGAIPTNEAGKD